jgi:hypothetical protein
MATEKQIAANRRNGALSRGPKTLEGKARSRHNALKHGLAARRQPDAAEQRDIEALTRAFSARAAPTAARALAQAQVEQQRVSRHRSQLLAAVPDPDAAGLEGESETISAIVRALGQMVRYERRASAKREQALRVLGGK